MSSDRLSQLRKWQKELKEEENKNESERDENKMKDLVQRIAIGGIGLDSRYLYGNGKKRQF